MIKARSNASPHTLDCTRPANCIFWFVVGAALALSVMIPYGAGNWTSLLRVGSRNPLLPRIEHELGTLSNADPIGHDGQLYYSIARDPLGVRGTPEAIAAFDNNGPGYRYRRILFPLLAGGFGQFGGRATLVGMILLLAMAVGMATVAIADISFQLRLRGGTVFAAAANAGALASLLLLTADTVAIALALAGIAVVFRARFGWAVILFALAALTKEVYVLVPISVAAWSWERLPRRQAAVMAVLPAAPVVLWSLWLVVSMPAATTTVRNVGLPLVGLSEALPLWIHGERNAVELFLIAVTALTFAAAAIMLIIGRNSLLRWLIAPWLGLACLATVTVWGKPNNISRAFAILWPLTVLLVSERLSHMRIQTAARTGSLKAPGSTEPVVLP